MATQTLNTVQRQFVNEVCRPMIENFIKFRYMLDAFVVEADNQQSAIAATADDLGDGADGAAPRDDAPVLTGALLLQLRNFAAGMRDQVTPAALNALVAVAVRDVQHIVGG